METLDKDTEETLEGLLRIMIRDGLIKPEIEENEGTDQGTGS